MLVHSGLVPLAPSPGPAPEASVSKSMVQSHLPLNLGGLDKAACSLSPYWGWGPEARGARTGPVLPLFFWGSSSADLCPLHPLPAPTRDPLAQCLVPKRGSQTSHLSVGQQFCIPQTSQCLCGEALGRQRVLRGESERGGDREERTRGRERETGTECGTSSSSPLSVPVTLGSHRPRPPVEPIAARLKEARLQRDDFEILKVIGRGAFSEVRSPEPQPQSGAMAFPALGWV